MSIPTLDVEAFDQPEHVMIAAANAIMDHFGIVARVTFRVDRSDGDWQSGTIANREREAHLEGHSDAG